MLFKSNINYKSKFLLKNTKETEAHVHTKSNTSSLFNSHIFEIDEIRNQIFFHLFFSI